MRKYIGTSTVSKNTKKRIRSSAANVPSIPVSSQAFCTLCSTPFCASPSIVVICRPATALNGIEHERIAIPSTCTVQARPFGRRFVSSRERDVVVLQRERADALARSGKVRVEHGGRGDADRRLADAAPETAGWHDDRFDLRHLGDAHRVVIIEVGLLDATVLDRAFLVEQGG